MRCEKCKFFDKRIRKCTYPTFIYSDEYIFEGRKIVGCKRGRVK